MFQWWRLSGPVYDYAKQFSLLVLWASIYKDIGAVEVLELLLYYGNFQLETKHL